MNLTTLMHIGLNGNMLAYPHMPQVWYVTQHKMKFTAEKLVPVGHPTRDSHHTIDSCTG